MNELGHVNLGDARIFELGNELFGFFFVDVLFEALDVPLEIDDAPLDCLDVGGEGLIFGDAARFNDCDLVLALCQFLREVSRLLLALLLKLAILHLYHLEIVLVFLHLVTESLGVILRFLAVEADCVVLVVFCIDSDKIQLVLQCQPLHIQELTIVLQLVLCFLNLVLVLKVILRDLVPLLLGHLDPALQRGD